MLALHIEYRYLTPHWTRLENNRGIATRKGGADTNHYCKNGITPPSGKEVELDDEFSTSHLVV